MRFYISVIAFISFVASSATESSYVDDIWLDGSSIIESGTEKIQNTIYFSKWDPAIDHYRINDQHSVAIQLDRKFDPLPFDEIKLLTLQSLSAVSSEEVIEDYLEFLEHLSRTKGIKYLVLPDTAGYTGFEKEVIQFASLSSPQFFIPKNILNHELPDSKKDFIAHVSDAPQILVANQFDNLKKITKWSRKFLPEEHQLFLDKLEESREQNFESVKIFPEDLRRNVFESGTFAIDADMNLPIVDSEIVYLGSNEKMKAWLSKYAIVHTKRKDGITTVVDLLSNRSIATQSGDIVLTAIRLDSENIVQLVLPISIANQEIHIAKMLFGAAEISGKNVLARTIPNMKYLGFSTSIEEGISTRFQYQIDSIGKSAINKYATPGMQMAVVKNGNLIYQRSIGTYTYDSIKQVESKTLYDLASLTKVMATLPAIGLLLDRGLIELDDSVSQHLSEFAGSNKGKATIRQLMAHNAGLKSYVPFWSMMMDGDRLDAFYYKTAEDQANDIRSYGFEPDPVMLDSLRSYIVKSDLIGKPEKYNYSDLGFMILHLIVERVTETPFDQFLAEEFYEPMGLTNTMFNPIARGHNIRSIAPTEYDQRFRDYLVWGEVHDRNAAVFGGVSGHAGLFSNAQDLAKMMSMYLNGGFYGGNRYLSEEVLEIFNKRYFAENRRGLGWDKKDGKLDAASTYASDKSFGHTGFTGTMVWADPVTNLIFVFLSNRIYPDANNNRLGEYNVRTSIHNTIYESIISEKNLKLN